MALVKTSGRFGKKPASGSARATVPGKSSVAKKSKTGAKSSAAKSHARQNRSSAKFSSLKSRQMTVESAKRLIWSSLHRITEALVHAASNGNLATAKELFHFAGVYSLPMPQDENGAAATAPSPAQVAGEPAASGEMGIVHPIDAFFNRIGIPPSDLPPEAEVA